MKKRGKYLEQWIYDTNSEKVIRWIDSRKGHRKSRWLKKLNRLLAYYYYQFGWDQEDE